MRNVAEFELSYQFNASAIDKDGGIIRGATVAQAGVEALGKFVFLDELGNITRDEKLARKKIPVYTDAKTLDTLMAAAQDAGGTLKIRSDHSENLQDRAGYADGFMLVGNRVTTDIHLHNSYRDREIVLETAAKTPKLIGLSIDMIPWFELKDGKAMMRIEELLAVDIVDAGAITHEGLFLNRGVDKLPTIKISTQLNSMATEQAKEPTVADCMKAITELAAAVSKLTPTPPAEKKDDAMAAVTALSDKMSAISAELVTLKKEKAALGINGEAALATAAAAEAESAKAMKLAAEKDAEAKKNLTFSQLVDAKHKESGGKLKRSDCSRAVMKEQPAVYAKHLSAIGLVRMTA